MTEKQNNWNLFFKIIPIVITIIGLIFSISKAYVMIIDIKDRQDKKVAIQNNLIKDVQDLKLQVQEKTHQIELKEQERDYESQIGDLEMELRLSRKFKEVELKMMEEHAK